MLQLHLQSVASPIYPDLEERGAVLSICDDEDDIAETNDAPTGNNPAGIGVEFESAAIQLASDDCSAKDFFAAKGKTMNGRKGKNWALTADHADTSERILSAEYILDGKSIKLSSNSAKEAAEAVAKDIVSDLSEKVVVVWLANAGMYSRTTGTLTRTIRKSPSTKTPANGRSLSPKRNEEAIVTTGLPRSQLRCL